MMSKLLRLTLACFIVVCTFAVPALAISVSCSSGAGGQAASSSESFNLDDSTSLRESIILGSGSISLDRQAEGTGKNSLKQSLSGNGYTLLNNINSHGNIRVSTSSGATAQAASLSQNVGAAGSMSLNLRGTEGATDAGQEASVVYGSLASSQILSAGQEQGVIASQSTAMEGLGGKVVSGAMGEENVVVARGSFEGLGILTANLDSATLDRASARGTAALDGVVLLDDNSFKALSSNSENRGMGMEGLRMTEGGLGNFDMSLLNTDLKAESGESYSTQYAATAGGSYSSYALTGFRWNQRDPKVQLYLNPTDTPSGLTAESSQNAISAAADTWDDAVSQNIFADGSTVKIDYTKQVANPFSGSMNADSFSANGWKNFGNSYLGVSCYWSNGQKVDGYYSLTEADTIYNLDYQWTNDWNTAVNTGKMDLQSVAVHELGHGIGMGDLYTLPSSDPRSQDFQQVMNLYDGPQRTLGNGDKTGVQKLYGASDSWFILDYNNDAIIDASIRSGSSGDLPIIGDWMGTNRDMIGLYNKATSCFRPDYNNDGIADTTIFFGNPGDLPIIGDWDGDGIDTIGLYRPTTSKFFTDYNNDGIADASIHFGNPGDLPIIGDWNGDGIDTIGLYRPTTSKFFTDYNNDGIADASIHFGNPGDLPTIGDWNGDGVDTVGLYRPTTSKFFPDYNNDGIADAAINFGNPGDKPIIGDWISQGKDRIGVYKGS
jgi:hypothetical protein